MTKAFDCAMRLLSRREHSAFELTSKLAQRSYPAEEICEAIAECQRLGLQSDTRFVEAYCYSRIRQGYGPLRIKEELRVRQIDHELVEEMLSQERDNWVVHALAVWLKKYKKRDDTPSNEVLKQQRFLFYRGFPTDIIAKVFAEL